MDDLDEDVRETLTEEEEELKAYLKNGESLSEDTMDKYTAQFWDTEPYKLVSMIHDHSNNTLRCLGQTTQHNSNIK